MRRSNRLEGRQRQAQIIHFGVRAADVPGLRKGGSATITWARDSGPGDGDPHARRGRRPASAPAVPKTGQITGWLLSRRALDAAEQAQLDAILARCPHLHALAGHLSAFAEMMTGLHLTAGRRRLAAALRPR
jgi:hypothetical protein